MRVIPAWTETIGALIEEAAIVRAHCDRCARERLVDLLRIQHAKGPLYSLWLRTAPCRTSGCPGRVWFSAQRPDAGAWPTNLRNVMRHQVEPLHARWRASLAEPEPPAETAPPLLRPPVRRLAIANSRRARGRR